MANRSFPGSSDHIRVSRPSVKGEDILCVKIPQKIGVDMGQGESKTVRMIICGKNTTAEEMADARKMVEESLKEPDMLDWACPGRER